jgi:hypothetical protein
VKGKAKATNLHRDFIELSLSVPTIDGETRDQLIRAVRDAVPFRIEREPAGIAEWGRVYDAAADLARKWQLVLPAEAVYFPFNLHAGRQSIPFAVIARQTAARWQHWVFLEVPRCLLPITMLHFPDRMTERRMPASLTWLENGSDAWPDANEFLSLTEAGLPPNSRQWIAHVAVQAGELLLYVAIAATGASGAGRVTRLTRPGCA